MEQLEFRQELHGYLKGETVRHKKNAPPWGERIKRTLDVAEEILSRDENAQGLRLAELAKLVQRKLRGLGIDMIRSSLSSKLARERKDITKPERGLYVYQSHTQRPRVPGVRVVSKLKEGVELYRQVAVWLLDKDECTQAIPLGGKTLGSKWTTPDVIGMYESEQQDLVRSATEVTTAEIKTRPSWSELVTGFGQACSYKLFSHRAWLFVPDQVQEDDMDRLETLCGIFGIGLAKLSIRDSSGIHIERKLRPEKHEPDLYYVNRYLEKVDFKRRVKKELESKRS